MNKNKKYTFLAAITLFVIAVLFSLCLGAAHLSLGQLYHAIKEGVNSGFAGNIFWYIRLPRTAACVFAGAGLFVTLCCTMGIISGLVIAGSAFLGALLAVMLVVFTAQKVGASKTTVILGGVAVNSFLNAASEAIVTLFPDVGVITGDVAVMHDGRVVMCATPDEVYESGVIDRVFDVHMQRIKTVSGYQYFYEKTMEDMKDEG